MFLFLAIFSFCVSSAQKMGVNNLIGKWRVCISTSAPLVFIFSNKESGERGLLRDWNDPSNFIYKTPFTYMVANAPTDSLTGNLAIDQNLF